MIAVVMAGVLALAATLLGTPWVIKFSQRHVATPDRAVVTTRDRAGLAAKSANADAASGGSIPSFGGAVIIVAAIAAYLVVHLIAWRQPVTLSGVLVGVVLVGLGVVGRLIDRRRARTGRNLSWQRRALGQAVVAVPVVTVALLVPDDRGIAPASAHVSFLRDIDVLQLPLVLAGLWLVVLIIGASNGLNLLNGSDGLATGASAMIFGAYGLINVWQTNQYCVRSPGPQCYEVRDPLDLTIVSFALCAACFGLLWWNCKPARIALGYSGALALGGAMAVLAIFTRTELLLLWIAGLVTLDLLSVVLQIGYFKITGGKRLFPMTPLRHSFEVLGWAEATVTIRFWILEGLFVATALAVFYAEWVGGT